MKKYICNRASGEIHRRDKLTAQCNIVRISDENYFECGGRFARKLIRRAKFDGCKFCNPKNHRK